MPITAAVVGDLRVRAVLAAHDMAAESHRAAALDRRHYLQLAETDVASIGLTPSRSMVAEDIRDLQGGTSHDRRGLCRRLLLRRQRSEPIQWAHVRAKLGSNAHRFSLRAGGWQSCGAMCEASRAS